MITHPDLPDTLVHFTGRSRGPKERQDFPPTTAEDRLVSILHSGTLRGAAPFGLDAPVLCFSEATEEARRVILRDGAGWGPYESWGLVLHRQQLIAAGARPVLYVSREERDQMKAVLPRRTYNRCVVYEPGREDWLHEREWRLCFEDDVEPCAAHQRRSSSPASIVGTQGWTPRPREVTFEARAETSCRPGVLAVRRRDARENPGPFPA
ncbi:hypothetical protein Shyd_83200 [Streptomyces hydrogenans]|uniref:Uncharacterized protein n=1 Tax=Streptomyces hydrogenans TaxID=1873719 RepID=A0ABQ3PPK9_9ACTN|nr:hypothetical protein [Streptomyces hydrogenans]GHI26949.1 hypothetical protein Shyd_83200 [Streptomyces hydrogenans]